MVHYAYFIYQARIVAQESPPYGLHVHLVCLDLRLKILKTIVANGDLSKKEYEDIAISIRHML